MNTNNLTDLTPSDAWEMYVGNQTVKEFLAFGEKPIIYVNNAPTCEGLDAIDRQLLADLLQAYINKNTGE